MQISTVFNVTSVVNTNITSSLAQNPNYKYFAALTRQLSTVSSQWIYRLDYYDYNTMTKLETIEVYRTYSQNTHFLTFIPSYGPSSYIAVSTINNLLFYQTSPLKQVAKFLHQQANIYQLTASPDGQLTVLVGQSIVIFRNTGLTRIIFPQVIQNARFCDFSLDGRYMLIASTSSLNIYTYQKNNNDYNFQQIPLTATAPVAYGSITSAQFNPTNSSQIIVGFLSTSPMGYSINDDVFFKKSTDIQPMESENAKIAKYMPDGYRFYSYDYLNGVGLWPGSEIFINNVLTPRLYYRQNFLLYNAIANSNGAMLLGFVWQSIKKVTLQITGCSKFANSYSCTCQSGYAWNFGTYSCQKLSCLQVQYATGVITNNQCVCNSGYIFSEVFRKCIIDCSIIPNALPTMPNLYQCNCANNWSWNALTRLCVFDCTQISFSSGTNNNSTSCNCLAGFNWNSSLNECVCPNYMQPSGGSCICITNYYIDPVSSVCVSNCSAITGTIGTASIPQNCLCEPSYYYTIKSQTPGCQLNCSAIEDTYQESSDFTTCICREHMDWFNTSCVVNCKSIQYSDPEGLMNNTCACAINYLWIDQIKQCAKNCSGVPYTIQNAPSTLISCPCVHNFVWSTADNKCQIQCNRIPNSEYYSLSKSNICQCRSGFVWNPTLYSCQIDCAQIWNAQNRINDSYCSCANDQPFNNQTLTCGSMATAGLFSNNLSIVGFAVGCVVVLIIMAILIRFCWKFSTDSNKQHEKKIKGKDGSKKKQKLIRGKQKVDEQGEEQIKTNERFTSPQKFKTNTTL